MTSSGRRRVAAVSVSAALTALVSACTSGGGPGPTLRFPHSGGRAGGELPDTAPGTSVLLPLGVLCTTGDPIRVDKVTAAAATGGLRVTSWGTRHLEPAQDPAGLPGLYAHGQVSSVAGFGTGAPVTSKCTDADGGPLDQFLVSVAAGTPRGTMTGVNVRYRSGRTVFAQFDLALCSSRACPPVSDR